MWIRVSLVFVLVQTRHRGTFGSDNCCNKHESPTKAIFNLVVNPHSHNYFTTPSCPWPQNVSDLISDAGCDLGSKVYKDGTEIRTDCNSW